MTDEYLHELICKYAEGKASEEEIKALMHWYRSYFVSEVTWPSSSNGEKQLVYNRVLSQLHKKIHPNRSIVHRFQWLRAAEMIFLLAGVATIVFFLLPSSPSFVTISNSSGKIQTLMLPDSSLVCLNAATTIRYDKEFVKNRYVHLDGEAYFDVKHDAALPFVIRAGEIENTVLGTRFNIEAYKNSPSVIVSLITGKLKVVHKFKELIVLTPKQQISFALGSGDTEIKNIDTSSVLSWMRGSLDFQGLRLSDIALELERWFNVDIELAPSISSCRYYLSFDNDVSLEEVLQSIAELSNIQYTIQHKAITITGEACK